MTILLENDAYVHPEMEVVPLDGLLLCQSSGEVSAGDLFEDEFERLYL